MNFSKAYELAEGYNYLNNRWNKNEDTHFHYTNPEAFIKIINSGALKGQGYTVSAPGNKEKFEVCVVRSDMSPDNYEVQLSGNTGDIKFIMDMPKIKNNFKVKTIAEIPIENGMYTILDLNKLNNIISGSFYKELLSIIRKGTMNPDDLRNKIKNYKGFVDKEDLLDYIKYGKELISDYGKSYAKTAAGENFHVSTLNGLKPMKATGREGEERILVDFSKGLPIKGNVKEIMIPNSLKNNTKILAVLPKAKQLVPKITWYDPNKRKKN